MRDAPEPELPDDVESALRDEAAHRAAWAAAFEADAVACFDLDVFTAPGEYQARLTLRGTGGGCRIAGLSAGRDLVERLGLGTPRGFHESPLAPEGRSAKWKAIVADLNASTVYWRGDVLLRPDEPYLLRVPAERLEAGFGHLSIDFGAAVGSGGGLTIRFLPIGLADARAARKAMRLWNQDRWGDAQAFAIPPYESESDYGRPVRTTPLMGGKLPRRTPPAAG